MRTVLFTLLMLITTAAWCQSNRSTWIFFETGQSWISAEGHHSLDSLVNLVQNREYRIEVYGHADSTGSASSNFSLSDRRSTEVKNYLVKKGLKDEFIVTRYFGESRPVFLESIESEFAKNRCVEVRVILQRDLVGSVPDTTNSSTFSTRPFENDTVLYFPNGTIIEVDASTFYPRKISEVNFNVTEVFTQCDMLFNNTVTRTTNGDCLTSAGMLFLKPTIDGIEVQPNGGKTVKIKFPMVNGIYDPEMSLYGGVKDENGEVVWKEIKSTVSYEEVGNRYYVFQMDTFRPINLDKKINVICQKNGPRIKLPKVASATICQTYPNETYLSVAAPVNKRVFALDEVILEKDPFITIVVRDKNGLPFMASGALKDLPYKKHGKTYLVKESYFRYLLDGKKEDKSDRSYICESMK